jgi:plasmid stability protein
VSAKLVRVNIVLDAELHRALRVRCAEMGVGVAEAIWGLVSAWVKKEEK